MAGGIFALASSVVRAAAQLRACARELKRIGDILEQAAPRQAGGFRSFYSDTTPRGTDEARLYTQSDEDLAHLEDLAERRARGERDPDAPLGFGSV